MAAKKGTKALPVEMRKAVAAEVEALIASHPKLTLRQLGELYEIPAGMLSTMREGEGIGIHTLLRLREIRQKPIDELLGLPPIRHAPSSAFEAEAEELARRVLAAAAARQSTPPTEPPSPPRGRPDAPHPHPRRR